MCFCEVDDEVFKNFWINLRPQGVNWLTGIAVIGRMYV